MSALAIDKVSHRYGATIALDGVSISVARGEILCLVGPSGCGKSTLLRIAAGLEPLQAGSVAIAGETVAVAGRPEAPPEARGVGFLFQDFALFPHLSVLENAAFGLHREGAASRRGRAMEALTRVGMAELADSYPHMLSGGQQQRVALARAMAPAPRLFLLDEPFSGIDARLRRRLLEDTWRVLKESGAASVVVTHDPEEAMLLGDRLAVMRAGQLLQIGTPDAVYRRPDSAFVAEFLGEVNKYRGTVGGDGRLDTPVGAVAAPGIAAGTGVVVIVRQHGVRVVAPDASGDEGDSVAATVEWVRPMGASSLVRLRRSDGGAEDQPIYARVPGRFDLAGTAAARIRVDRDEVFVFPAETPTSVA
ncbi:MAG: ABC transporter ATP-binding protein [Rhodospirillaceae bacterium]|nr:ABC transporter ATP-binding protein [Rhodospirillaceae bacterium]